MKNNFYENFDSFSKELIKIRKSKKKIVLCHGVFDLFHIGHLNYFEEAKSHGDILIVSLTVDKFVKKAPNRPFFNIKDRAKLLNSIRVVDYVIQSNHETSVEVINFLKPNIYFKGPDYKKLKDDITGNIHKEISAVKKNKGKILIGSTETHSSSKLLNSLQNFTKEQKTTIEHIKSNHTTSSILEMFEKAKKEKILIFGESIIDKFIFCKNIGRSGKESIQTVENVSEKKYIGGTLSTSANLSKVVSKVELLTSLGRDLKKKNFCKSKLNKKITLHDVPTSNNKIIEKCKIVTLDDNQKILGLYDFNDVQLNLKSQNKIKKKFLSLYRKFNTILVMDYGHGLISKHVSSEIVKRKIKHLYVNTQLNAANFGFHNIGKYKNVSYGIINEVELRHEMRDRYTNIEKLIPLMAKKTKIENMIITCGNRGSYSYNLSKNKLFFCAAFATDIVDKIGAGDMFMSVFSIFHKYCKGDFVLSMFISSLATFDVLSGFGNEKLLNFNDLKKRIVYLLK